MSLLLEFADIKAITMQIQDEFAEDISKLLSFFILKGLFIIASNLYANTILIMNPD